MYMKQHIINKVKAIRGVLSCLVLFTFGFLTSCINDEGSYDYTELAEITIEGIPEITEVLGHVENISWIIKVEARSWSHVKPRQ